MGERRSVRLQVYLSSCGLGSRRLCERLILDRRVKVNGSLAKLGMTVEPGDRVCFDGKSVAPLERYVYIALNKPSGYLCTNDDPFGRPLAIDLLKESLKGTRVFHVGRLDFLSSGLIFYTNDGQFAQSVSHPSAGVRKTYQVETWKRLDEDVLKRYKKGLAIGVKTYRLYSYRALSERKYQLILIEGKNREIRRVFNHFGYKIKTIHRIKIGVVSLGRLKLGESRSLTDSEVDWFLSRLRSKEHHFRDCN
jgi:23S rRNA pseudouridine2605 synthase